MVNELGTTIGNAFSVQSRDDRLKERIEEQLCLKNTALAKLFGPAVIQSVAITGSDPYLREGSDITLLFDAKNKGLFLAANFGRVSAAPRFGTREIWHLKNDGGGWDHPIHIHFEECQTLARDGKARKVPAAEQGRKDVWRLRPSSDVTITLQFRDFAGMFMEHCHNTTHEDFAMLLRWEIDDKGAPFVRPLPTPIPRPQGVEFQPPDETITPL